MLLNLYVVSCTTKPEITDNKDFGIRPSENGTFEVTPAWLDEGYAEHRKCQERLKRCLNNK